MKTEAKLEVPLWELLLTFLHLLPHTTLSTSLGSASTAVPYMMCHLWLAQSDSKRVKNSTFVCLLQLTTTKNLWKIQFNCTITHVPHAVRVSVSMCVCVVAAVSAAAPLAITFKAVVVLANANDPHKTDKSQAESGERHRSRAALPEAHTHTLT